MKKSKKELINKFNKIIMVLVVVWIIVGNILLYPEIIESFKESSLNEIILFSFIGIVLGVIGTFVIYRSLLKMHKIIYIIIIFLMSLSIIGTIAGYPQNVTNLIFTILIELPLLVCSLLILFWLRSIKKWK